MKACSNEKRRKQQEKEQLEADAAMANANKNADIIGKTAKHDRASECEASEMELRDQLQQARAAGTDHFQSPAPSVRNRLSAYKSRR